MTERRTRYGSLVPLVLLASAPATRCELSTDGGTGELHIRGTVRFLEVAGGCWQLDAGGGARYELLPAQTPDSLLRQGASVVLVGRLVESSETGCSVGLPIAVRRVVSFEPGPATPG